MGIFDKILGTKDVEKSRLNKEESFAAIILSAVAADGKISDEEAMSIAAMRFFNNFTRDQSMSMFKKLINILRNQGIENLILASKDALSLESRQTAFAMAVDLTLADGVINQEEKNILDKIQKTLEIPEDIAIKIIDVILIKNKY